MDTFEGAGVYASWDMENLLNADKPQAIASTSLNLIPDSAKMNISKISVYPSFFQTKTGNITIFAVITFALLMFLAGFK
jgi:hypothetical protein